MSEYILNFALVDNSTEEMENFGKNVRNKVRQYTSPVLILSLVAAFVLWYIVKLNYSYTTKLMIDITIDSGNDTRGETVAVPCIAEGLGYKLLAHKVFGHRSLKLQLSDVKTTPSVEDDSQLLILPESILNAISTRNSDIRILSVEEIPAIRKP